MPARLLVLSIDAASPALLDRWCAAGELPTIAQLLGRGAVARTKGIEGLFVGATWPSFSAGVGPGRHGIHHLTQLPPGRLDYEPISGWPERAEPFWVAASRAGRRIAILDAPLSRIADGLNGVQTVEWGSHDNLFGFRASPPSLQKEIETRFGPHPQTGTCDAVRTTAADYDGFVRRLVDGVSVKSELTRRILASEEWDLLLQVFTEAHCAGHQCWHLHDQAHPAYNPEIAASIGDPLLRVYRAIDTAIAEILAAAPDATVILFTAHDMGYFYGAQLLLPEILFRLGVAEPTAEAARRRSRWWETARTGWHALPKPLRARLRPDRSLPAHTADPRRSLCFPVANGLAVGGIRLNIAGREPTGMLTPVEAELFADELAADLLAVVDPRSGRPLVGRVARSAELFDGPALELLPDLLVEWNDNGPTPNSATGPAAGAVVAARSPKIGSISALNRWPRTGEHRPDGLVAAIGPGIQPARLPEQSLLDVAPSILALLGVEPSAMDGRPIDGFGPALV
jgi:predicted AlkP superfamily phosphohydrolase/phosphomutase